MKHWWPTTHWNNLTPLQEEQLQDGCELHVPPEAQMLLPALLVPSSLLTALPVDAVIDVDFRFDVTHQRQQLGEDQLTVLLEVLLDYTHLFLGLLLDFGSTAAMRSKCLQTAKGRESLRAKKALTGSIFWCSGLPCCISAMSAEEITVLEEVGACLDCPLRFPT